MYTYHMHRGAVLGNIRLTGWAMVFGLCFFGGKLISVSKFDGKILSRKKYSESTLCFIKTL